MREVVLDTETTGLSASTGDKIIEIACVELNNFVPSGKIFQKYINPEKIISESAEKIHGLTNNFLDSKPLFKDVVPEFLNFIKNSPLIIHNADFDMGFIKNELKRNNLKLLNNSVIDTLQLAREKFPGSPVNLDALCRRYNIDLSVRKKHGALIDAKLTAQVYLELKGGQQPNFNLISIKDVKKKIIQKNEEEKTKKWEERSFELTKDEILKHKEFIKKLKNPTWNSYD